MTSADGDGGDLARLAAAQFAGAAKPLLYLAGEERARDLGGELAASGLKVATVVVYRTVKAVAFPADVRAAFVAGAVDGVLHFSRRSVESYLDCARDAGGPALLPIHYCLSGGRPSRCGRRRVPRSALRPGPTRRGCSLWSRLRP